jgi:hypothetical protein
MEDGIIQLIKNMIKTGRFGQVNDAAFDGTDKVAEMMIPSNAQNYFFILDCFGNSQMGTESRYSIQTTVGVYPINFLNGIHKKR